MTKLKIILETARVICNKRDNGLGTVMEVSKGYFLVCWDGKPDPYTGTQTTWGGWYSYDDLILMDD